jgi:hypothetical protein
MCLISQEVETVNDTKIFCGLNSNKNKQITVYSNTVNNISNNNAMVLPVPFPDSVNFHNLENYKKFFEDCEECFYLQQSKSFGSRGITTNSYDSYNSKSAPLKVFDVGSYKVSLAKNLNDLKRVNKSVFDLSTGLDEILRKNYANPHFGFIICKLSEGNESYHPFAYSHNIFNKKVFIPTKHYHNENTSDSYFNPNGGLDFSNAQSWNGNLISGNDIITTNSKNTSSHSMHSDDAYADDWGHDIYLYNVDIRSNNDVKQMNKSKYVWNNENKIKFHKLDFALDKNCVEFRKVQINGRNKNVDLILQAV